MHAALLRMPVKGQSVAFMSTAMSYAKNGPASEVLRYARRSKCILTQVIVQTAT